MIQPARIEDHWSWMEPHVRRLMERNKELNTPEDLYEAVSTGKAQLFVAPDGFVIWSIRQCPRTKDLTFWVWVAWGNGGNMIHRYEPELVKLAELAGAKKMAFSSPRKGYQRALDEQWSVARVEYERSL